MQNLFFSWRLFEVFPDDFFQGGGNCFPKCFFIIYCIGLFEFDLFILLV